MFAILFFVIMPSFPFGFGRRCSPSLFFKICFIISLNSILYPNFVAIVSTRNF